MHVLYVCIYRDWYKSVQHMPQACPAVLVRSAFGGQAAGGSEAVYERISKACETLEIVSKVGRKRAIQVCGSYKSMKGDGLGEGIFFLQDLFFGKKKETK